MKKTQVQFLSQEDSPGEGNPLQYCLEKPMDRGARRTTVQGSQRVRYDLATKQQPPHNSTSCFLPFLTSSRVHACLDITLKPLFSPGFLAGPAAIILPMIQDCVRWDQRLDKEVLLSLFPWTEVLEALLF